MKKILLTVVAALGIFVACEKDEFAALDQELNAQVERLDAADDLLQSNIDDLRSDFDAFVADINERLASAVAALEAADQAITDFFNAAVAELHNKLDKAVIALNASISENTDLIKETGKELRKLIVAEAQARAAGDLEIANELADQVAKLEKQDSIAARNIGRNFTHIGNLSSALLAERAARVAADADLQSQVSSNTLNIASNLASINTNINDINLNFLDIVANDGDIASIQGVNIAQAGSISSLQASLTATIADLDAAVLRIEAVEAFASRIATLESEVAALELAVAAQGETDGNHASTLTTIQTSVTNLRTSLETFATNGDTAISNRITTELARVDGLLAGLRTDLTEANRQIQWQNGLIADLTLRVTALENLPANVTASVSGTILTLTVSGTEYTIDSTGGSDGNHGANGAPGADGAAGPAGAPGVGISNVAYDAATGILTISFTDGRADFQTGDLRGPAGSGSGNGVAITWSPLFTDQTADFTQTGNLDGAELTRLVSVSASAPVNTPGAATVVSSFTSNGSPISATSLEAARIEVDQVGTWSLVETRVTTYALGTSVITWSATANGAAYGSHDVSSDYQAPSTTEVLPAVEHVNAPTDSGTDTIGYTAWVGDAPAAVVEDGPWGEWTLAPASSTESTTTRFRARTQISVVAEYTQTRTGSVTIVGIEDVPALQVDPASLTQTIAEVRTSLDDEVETEVVANPGYVAPVVQDPADVAGNWIYSVGTEADWNAGVIDGSFDTSVEVFGASRSRITTINGDADMDYVAAGYIINSAGNAVLVENKDLRNSAYVAPVADVFSAWSSWTVIASDASAPSTQEFIMEERTRTIVSGSPVGDLRETRQVANPAYVAPGPDPVAVTGTLNFTSNFAGLGVLGFTATYTVNGQAGVTSIDFTEAGTYTIAVANSVGPVGTADIVVDASDDAGTYHITADASGVTITKQ